MKNWWRNYDLGILMAVFVVMGVIVGPLALLVIWFSP